MYRVTHKDTEDSNLTGSHDRNPLISKLHSFTTTNYVELSFEVYNSFLGQLA